MVPSPCARLQLAPPRLMAMESATADESCKDLDGNTLLLKTTASANEKTAKGLGGWEPVCTNHRAARHRPLG